MRSLMALSFLSFLSFLAWAVVASLAITVLLGMSASRLVMPMAATSA